MKIKIHNDIWKVKLVASDAKKMNPSENSFNFGLTEYLKLQINIRSGIPESVARPTIIHELTHAFLFSYGNKVEGEEQMCEFYGVHGDEIITLTDRIMKEVIHCC